MKITENQSKKQNIKWLETCYVILVFGLMLALAIGTKATSGPDESMKYDICKYIVQHGSLPDGRDPAIRNALWGTSYGFNPILSYMISAVFLKVTTFFTMDMEICYLAVRMVSVLCITGMTVVIMRIGGLLFRNVYVRWLFIAITTLLPQVLYLGSYLNNDAFALLTISLIIYAWLLGLKNSWNMSSCILLAVSIGLCALSYYNAYGYILCSMILFFVSYRRMIQQKSGGDCTSRNMWKKAGIITAIALLIAGWWFIRSAILYNGDFLGLNTSNAYAEQFAQNEFKPSLIANPYHQGWSLYEMLITNQWLKTSLISFVGVLRTCDITSLGKYYIILWLLFMVGYLGFVCRVWKSRKELFKGDKICLLLYGIFVISIVIPIALSLYYSYYSDFQPQGRYLMPMLIPFAFFCVTGLEYWLKRLPSRWRNLCCGLTLGLIGAIALICVKGVITMI